MSTFEDRVKKTANSSFNSGDSRVQKRRIIGVKRILRPFVKLQHFHQELPCTETLIGT